MRTSTLPGFSRSLSVAAILVCWFSAAVAQPNARLLHTFNGDPDCNDAAAPLISDAEGNLYGATYFGGAASSGCIFELSPTENGWQETVLYSFSGRDGSLPSAALVFDKSGNLYGTAQSGGAYDYGVAYELSPSATGAWTEKVLHSFGKDGWYPASNLIFDDAGNLYGTTFFGANVGGGTVFKLTPHEDDWTETLLYSFPDSSTGPDGYSPAGGLVMDREGKLYGATSFGGEFGNGAIYELEPSSNGYHEKVIYSFNGSHGSQPNSNLTIGREGNLYGATNYGGEMKICDGGCGVIFKLARDAEGNWKEKVLHCMMGRDGSLPVGPVSFDDAGNLYASANAGGIDWQTGGVGSVLKLTPRPAGEWLETLLHLFSPATYHEDGGFPAAVIYRRGKVFGATAGGGTYGSGIVFEITPPLADSTSHVPTVPQ
jgi:uncharacterized repeat protein (TIGR03803 family)